MTDSLNLMVKTSQHDYPIIIDTTYQGEFFALDFSSFIVGKQVLIVTNTTIAPLYLESLAARLSAYQVATCVLPDGENFKTQDSINLIYDTLMKAQFSRDCTLIALGGGVIGDMVGFAAASFMRGVNFIQIPTTLLSQVDSSVGGKTGINHNLGKNMIGAFWQPICVLADMKTLDTLPVREFNAGMAEVIKYALIMDKSFLAWIKENHVQIKAKNPKILGEMVYRSCQYKSDIVAQDEKESGVRAYLNFGHTFGHVIETYMGYGNWLHGEAVAAGMVQAARLSKLMGFIDDNEIQEIIEILELFELPTKPPVIPVDVALTLMGHDKKVKGGKLRLIVLEQIGQARLIDMVDIMQLQTVLTTGE